MKMTKQEIPISGHWRDGIKVTSHSRMIDLNRDKKADIIMKIERDSPGKTAFRQDSRTGLMEGRRDIPGKGDGTAVRRVVEVKKGPGFSRLSSPAQESALERFRAGEIVGRFRR